MRLANLLNKTITVSGINTTDNSEKIPLDGIRTLSIQCVLAVDAPAAKTCLDTATSAAADTMTITAHGFTTGLKVGAASDGTLPAPLAATNYFVIKIDANTIKLATTLANALAGTAINLTDAGSAGQTTTLTPAALAGGAIKLQKSNIEAPTSDADWSDEGNSTAVTVSATVWLEKDMPGFKWARIVTTLTAGQLSSVNTVLAKGFV